MCLCVCVGKTTTDEKRGHEFEGEQGEIKERVWREEKRGKCCNYNLKNGRNNF